MGNVCFGKKKKEKEFKRIDKVNEKAHKNKNSRKIGFEKEIKADDFRTKDAQGNSTKSQEKVHKSTPSRNK